MQDVIDDGAHLHLYLLFQVQIMKSAIFRKFRGDYLTRDAIWFKLLLTIKWRGKFESSTGIFTFDLGPL